MPAIPEAATPALHLRDLQVTAPSGRVLLNIAALDVPAGDCVGVTGPSGAGKSTLLYALAGLMPNASGIIRWGDTDLNAQGEAARAAFRADNIGMIFQDFLLFDELDAAANASVASLFRPASARADIRDRAASLLDRLGISPDPRSVASYSGGERQRVAVARALANDPGILLADEPTASLHREAADRLSDDLIAMARDFGKTLIVVSHDAALIGRMDRVLTIRDGALLQEATA